MSTPPVPRFPVCRSRTEQQAHTHTHNTHTHTHTHTHTTKWGREHGQSESELQGILTHNEVQKAGRRRALTVFISHVAFVWQGLGGRGAGAILRRAKHCTCTTNSVIGPQLTPRLLRDLVRRRQDANGGGGPARRPMMIRGSTHAGDLVVFRGARTRRRRRGSEKGDKADQDLHMRSM